MAENRDFKGVWFPKEIWLSEELTLLEKAIYIEIDSLDNENNCTAGNEYFSKFCQCSESKVSKAIKKLQDLGMIEIISFDGRRRKIRVVKNTEQESKKYETESYNLRPNNINNKKRNNKNLSKDKLEENTNADKEPSFSLGKSKKEKKPSLFSRCESMINEYTQDKELQKALEDYLRVRLEIKDKPLYANSWKGLLNKLEREFKPEERLQVVYQSIERGYASFFPTGSKNYTKNNKMAGRGEKTSYTAPYEGIPHDGRYDDEDHTRSGIIF